MHGIPGASQVLAALLHGVCTLHTSSKKSDGAWVEGSFPVDTSGVQASTAAFLAAMEPHPMWNGPLPVCLVEHHRGNPGRLRLVLTSQTLLYPGERLLLSQDPRVHGSGLHFGCAADGTADPDWLVVPDGVEPHAWRLLDAASKGRHLALATPVAICQAKLKMWPTRQENTISKPCTRFISMMHGVANQS